MKRLLFALVLSLSFAVFAQDLFLVKNGKTKAVIIIENDNVSTKKAGEELQ